MPVIQKQVTVPANDSVDNALSGSAFEFLRRNAIVSMGVTAASSGIQVNIQSGADIIVEESTAAIKTTYPTIPDDMYYNDVGAFGDRLVVRLRNTTGAGVVARVLAQITEL